MQIVDLHSGNLTANTPFISTDYESSKVLGYIVSPLSPVADTGMWGTFNVLLGNNYRATGSEPSFFQYNRLYPLREEFREMASRIRIHLLPDADVNVSINLILDDNNQGSDSTMNDWQVGDLIFSMATGDNIFQRWGRLWLPLPGYCSKATDERVKPLFLMLWQYPTIWVDGGRGASALVDWDAGKTLFLPDPYDRVIGCTGGSKMGIKEGEESHRITVGEMPRHSHRQTTTPTGDSNHTHVIGNGVAAGPNPPGGGAVSGYTEEAGNSEPIPLIQPTSWFVRSALVCASDPL